MDRAVTDGGPAGRGRVIVVGSPSLDLLHFRGRSERSPGGAGLYTALAAQLAGAAVTMIAPKPEPMPAELAEAARRLDWRGRPITSEQLPHFEIEHRADGETIYHAARRGAEGSLGPDDLPDPLDADLVYIVPLLDPLAQLELARHVARSAVPLACGAYRSGVARQRAIVEDVLRVADYFFCNQEEARLLFGALDRVEVPAGKVMFMTRGAEGARVYQGSHATDVPPVRVDELDPTGAGDTFCGTTLAHLVARRHPVVAAGHAARQASRTVTAVGPAALLAGDAWRAPEVLTADPRVRIDRTRIESVASVIARTPEAAPFEFTGPTFPEPKDPGTLDFFFAATAQQFGFWHEDDGRYAGPMVGTLAGRELKGSDFLWAAYRRWYAEAADELTPAGQAALALDTFAHRLRDDRGGSPLPDLERAHRVATSYGRDMVTLETTPAAVVAWACGGSHPLARFLARLDHVGGYKEDPLRKKSSLLAVILAQRPERWLAFGPGEDAPPIVDYHVQRTCLRTGMVRVEDPRLRSRLIARTTLTAEEEGAVRRACYAAVDALRDVSGRPMGAVDWFLFQNRTRCPEMTQPRCIECPLEGVCVQDIQLFQPVFRTAAY